MGKRRRSSKGSKQNSPIAPTKKTKPSHAVGKANEITNTAPSVISEQASIITEGATVENLSEVGAFGEITTNNFPNSEQIKTKIPPVVVKNISLDQLQCDLTKKGINAHFKLTRMGIKIIVTSKSELENTKSYLKTIKTEFYSHDIPGEKPFKAVLRGLPPMATKDIEAELINRYKLQTVAVYTINRKQKQSYFRNNLYLVHFQKGSVTLGALKAVRSILNVIVSWEAYKGTHRDVTQCMRCLHFGHGTRNCSMNPRCSTCAESHLTSECPNIDTESFNCANCSQSHKATDKKCEKREEYKRIRREASIKNQPGRRTSVQFQRIQEHIESPNSYTQQREYSPLVQYARQLGSEQPNKQLYKQLSVSSSQPRVNTSIQCQKPQSFASCIQQRGGPSSKLNPYQPSGSLQYMNGTSSQRQDPLSSAPCPEQRDVTSKNHQPSTLIEQHDIVHHDTQVGARDNNILNSENITIENKLYTSEELVKIFLLMSEKLKNCSTRHEQIETLGSLIIQYGR